jgi:transposase-like protein
MSIHASKEEREYLKAELERILYTLINSTRRHASDGDHEALRRRIESTLRELSILAAKLKRRGYRDASEFIAKNGKLLVTFAELTLQGLRVPYTTNQIERLMGEIAKRCKHRWAHWSDEGLKNILTLILIHYTNPTLYEEYWQNYIHQDSIKTTPLNTNLAHNWTAPTISGNERRWLQVSYPP